MDCAVRIVRYLDLNRRSGDLGQFMRMYVLAESEEYVIDSWDGYKLMYSSLIGLPNLPIWLLISRHSETPLTSLTSHSALI